MTLADSIRDALDAYTENKNAPNAQELHRKALSLVRKWEQMRQKPFLYKKQKAMDILGVQQGVQQPRQPKLNYDQYIAKLRDIFGFNSAPYDEIDGYLLLLAVSPRCNFLKGTNRILNTKYQTCSHQSLEFYGDGVLYGITAMILFNTFGLSASPGILTKYRVHVTRNQTLTDVLLGAQVCQNLEKYVFPTQAHNMCADTFEAIIGVLFYHFYHVKKDPGFMMLIYHWIEQNTHLIAYFTEFLYEQRDIHSQRPVVTGLTEPRETIDEQTIRSVYAELGEDDLDDDFIQKELEEDRQIAMKTLAPKTLIYTHNPSLTELYRDLGWGEPVLEPEEEGLYSIYGNPRGGKMLIGIGLDQADAENNAKEWLFAQGYYILQQKLPHFPLKK